MSLEHKDIEIVAACRDSSRLIPHYSGEVRAGDLRDPDYLDRVLTGIDIICHAAGWSSFENSGKQCNSAYLEPTIDLINRAIEWRVSRFVNLSSLFVSAASRRNLPDIKGKPRAYWPMMNCILAVENYLQAYAQANANSRCQFINLRLGVYSGKRLNMGLLPLLLSRSQHHFLPCITGSLGHLPLVDGRDIGQAFARAALVPADVTYRSLNISGPETPEHIELMRFIDAQINRKPLNPGLPSPLSSPILWLQGKLRRQDRQPLFTTAMLDMLKSPPIDNTQAIETLGYDPEISWQASLVETLEGHKNQTLNTKLTQSVRPLSTL